MSKKLNKNLNLLMSEANLNAEELSRRIGIPASTIKKIRSLDNTNPTLSTLEPLAKYFSLTISQLVGDEPFPISRVKGSYKIDPEALNPIPVIPWHETITWPAKSNQTNYQMVFTEYSYSKRAYALLVEEEHWENLTKGTALIIDPLLKAEHRDFIIVHKKGQQVPTLKQLLFDEDQMYLKPMIQGYCIALFTPEHKILGVVAEYRKHLKDNLNVNY